MFKSLFLVLFLVKIADTKGKCSPNPCHNDGTCTARKTKFKCTCVPGYTGVICQEDIDECENHVCQNGATCVDIVNGFLCTCAGGFAGDFCETVYSCLEPDAPTNGFVNTSAGLEVGNIIYYTCMEGYGLVGQSQRTCLANLTWSDSIPYCMIECPQLHIPNGAADTSEGRNAGSTAVFMCTAGYTLSGNSKLVCELTGFWKGVKPTCNPVWMWAVVMTILVLMLFVSVVTIICLANTHCTYELTP
ncbi:hypothetical protein DPMN_013375 [Dreissena polymorpha]|uniref:Uncharacterized protein n=1 Tax=Dreissena polymorpha TaxID=45954 RepID=A0A9D4S498_DREPO|nr:hypothetical protein DPMN_013375 [Dreissena polymorpha]